MNFNSDIFLSLSLSLSFSLSFSLCLSLSLSLSLIFSLLFSLYYSFSLSFSLCLSLSFSFSLSLSHYFFWLSPPFPSSLSLPPTPKAHSHSIISPYSHLYIIYFRLEAQLRYLVNCSFDALQDCSIIHYQSIDPTEFHKEYHNETKDKSEVQVEIVGLDTNGI